MCLTTTEFLALARLLACSYISIERLAVSVSCHLREVRCYDPADAELEAVGLGEVALHSQADSLAGWGNKPAPVKHFFPAARHVGYIFCFHHVL